MDLVSRIERWIQNARETAEAHEENEVPPEDSVSTASSLRSSHLSIRQLKAKQALAR